MAAQWVGKNRQHLIIFYFLLNKNDLIKSIFLFI